MPGYVGTRLSIMMFLQFFVWGAWWVTVGNYMQSDAVGMKDAIYWAYLTSPIGAIVSPFFLGMIADRFFSTERVLAAMHLIGGVLLFFAPRLAEGPHASAFLFVGILQLHMLCYMPTLGLTNTLAFHNLTNQEKQFPLIRVFGTLGWIVANMVVSDWLKADFQSIPIQIAGGAGVLMGLYSLTLPHTPPPSAGKKADVLEIIGVDALVQLHSPSFWVFIVCSMLVCIPLSAYYAYAPVFLGAAGIEAPAATMKWGQISEVGFMILMPLFFARLGVKWMLFVGMAAWAARYGLFAGAAPDGIFWMMFIAVLLHGICYDFFFVTGQIYVDKKAPPAIRGQGQGFLVLATLGVGMLIGTLVSGKLFNSIVTAEGAEALKQYQVFWMIPAVGAAVIMLVFAAVFRERLAPAERVSVDAEEVAEAAAREEGP
jgi:nucleoside transporter